MNSRKEENTILFYKELNKKKSSLELLIELAYDGIFLYTPLFNFENIKYHVYAVTISLKYRQYCMIYSKKQFKELLYILSITELSDRGTLLKLIIPNEFFMRMLSKSRKICNIYKYGGFKKDFILYYFLKFGYISYKIFDYFQPNFLSVYDTPYLVFLNEFYLKENKYLINLSKYMDLDNFLIYLKFYFDRDINAFEYISNIICNNDTQNDNELKNNNKDFSLLINKYYNVKNLKQSNKYCTFLIRIKPFYPLELLKEYSLKSYKPNILYLKHNNKYIEDFYNAICSDKTLKYFSKEKKIGEGLINKEYFDAYNIPYRISDFEILNAEKYENPHLENNNRFIDEKNLWFGNKNLFNINYDLKIHNISDSNIYRHQIQEIREISKDFKNKYLNDDELVKILDDPEYILYKFENDSQIKNKNWYFYFVIIRCIVIGSLIYNKQPKFLIHSLSCSLKMIFDVDYNASHNKLYINRIKAENRYNNYYDFIISSTLMTSNIKFNEIFVFKF